MLSTCPLSHEEYVQLAPFISIFDEGSLGLILDGMPDIEKRIAQFPQFYSRIGFVHEFRPLDSLEMRALLEKC